MAEALSSNPARASRRGASLWAFVLIVVGVIWLLGQMGVLSAANFIVLYRLWPVILIAVGIQLLFGNTARVASRFIFFGLLGFVVVAMLVGPALGFAALPEAQIARFSEPLDGTASAEVELGLGVGSSSVNGVLSDSLDLIQVDARYYGDIEFDVDQDDDAKSITLRQTSESQTMFNIPFLNIDFNTPDPNLYTRAHLSSTIPLDLKINGGVGTATVDLATLTLTRFAMNAGVGRVDLTLPVVRSIDVDINGGVGEIIINVPDGASFRADINGGVGNIQIDLPDDAPIRIEASEGIGSVSMPSFLHSVSDETWESVNFSDSADEDQIVISYDSGVGGLIVR
ncbi:MAG: DUF5668 domain-containing protein [Chloroflexota bacterium]|nr:DUF5668 domain-containing protein [Chloroflexota bacterium]